MNTWYGIEVREANVVELNAIKWASDYNTFTGCNVLDDMDCPVSLSEDDTWYVDEDAHTAYCVLSASSNGKWIHVRELRYGQFIAVANVQ